MKKVLFSLLSASALLCSTSCSDEAVVSPEVGGEAMVNFTVELNDGNASRAAISDGKKATELYYEVYSVVDGKYTLLEAHDNWQNDEDAGEPIAIVDGKAKVGFALVKGQTYDVVFWAQKPGAYDAKNLQNINVSSIANNEDKDAFTAVHHILKVDGAKSETVTLTRPFAQVNFGAPQTDIDDAIAAGVVFGEGDDRLKSRITVKSAALSFNALTGFSNERSEQCVAQVFGWNKIPSFDEKIMTIGEGVDAVDYRYLATAYVLVPETNQGVADLKLELETGLNEIITLEVPAAPVQRNYRTNVIGNLLTNQTDFTVIVNPIYAGEETINIWDGKSVEAPAYNETTKTYTVDSPENFAWLAAAVNGTLPESRATEAADNFAGKTFVLTEDINLANQAWTPIGNSNNPFKGTFDGNGKTIHNLNVQMAGDSNAGLFGVTHDGEIKNLTVENATVVARLNVGVVAGQPYTSKYTNITVKGLVQVNGMAYVGAVGGKNAYADWTDVKVEAAEGSYVKANSIENGTAYRTYVGGVVGFNGEGTHTFKNITSNIDVKGSTCDVGGLFGIAHYGNKFESCVCTGNVEITNAAEADEAQEIGGIAGVWHNGGENVVLTNCSFTGNLTTNVAVEYYYGGLVGKPYSATGNGKLIIDDMEFDTTGVNLNNINAILAKGNGYVFPFDLIGKANASNAYGNTGLNQLNGGVLDGVNHTLKVTGANATWSSAINTTGGTIKNLTVAQGFRGIFVNHNGSYSDKVVLENVTINGPVYTISCDQGTNKGLDAYNSTFNGWTSYAATIGNVRFFDCEFGKGAGYKFARPYAPTQFINCNFCKGFEVDPRAKVTFTNCTIGGVALTAENLATLVTSNTANATIGGEIETTEGLKAAVATEGAVVFVKAGEYTFPSSVAAGVVIKCEEGTEFKGNSKLNINGATVEGAIFSNPTGTAVDGTINGVLKNCKFEGSNAARWCYAGETCVFENCKFTGSTYGVHFDGGANDVVFKNCELSGFNALAGAITMATFEGCKFVPGTSDYNGANLWGSAKLINCEFTFNGSVGNEWIDCIGADKTYEITNCTVKDVAYTKEKVEEYKETIFSRNHATVKVNGVDCQF